MEGLPSGLYCRRSRKGVDPGASQVNGIKDEDVAGEKKFIEIAPEVVSWLKDSDLAGYNSTKFDLPMLAEEIERVHAYCNNRLHDPKASAEKKAKAQATLDATNIDLHAKQMIDVQTIYHYMEPRNLKAAYRFYCGGEDFEVPIQPKQIHWPPTKCSRVSWTGTRHLTNIMKVCLRMM